MLTPEQQRWIRDTAQERAQATVGQAGVGGLHQPLLIFVMAVGLVGATVVVAELGEVWAEVTGHFRRPSGNWLPAILFSAALFSMVLWASDVLREVLEFGGWSWASGEAMWASQAVMVGVASGLVGTAVEVGFRLVAGPPGGGQDELAQRFFTYVWLAAVVGAVAALLLALMNGYPGRGAAFRPPRSPRQASLSDRRRSPSHSRRTRGTVSRRDPRAAACHPRRRGVLPATR